MNQISPKIFEAISHKTALILFEGSYSGVITPHKHYIPLKKDFSNVDDIFKILQDDDKLDSITNTAFNDCIASGKYSYQALITQFDAAIGRFLEQAG
jgi:hypothetical protein